MLHYPVPAPGTQYSTLPLLKAVGGVQHLVKESEVFINAYGAGQVRNDTYPSLITHLLHIFRQMAEALEEAWSSEAVAKALEQSITAMEQQRGSLAR